MDSIVSLVLLNSSLCTFCDCWSCCQQFTSTVSCSSVTVLARVNMIYIELGINFVQSSCMPVMGHWISCQFCWPKGCLRIKFSRLNSDIKFEEHIFVHIFIKKRKSIVFLFYCAVFEFTIYNPIKFPSLKKKFT